MTSTKPSWKLPSDNRARLKNVTSPWHLGPIIWLSWWDPRIPPWWIQGLVVDLQWFTSIQVGIISFNHNSRARSEVMIIYIPRSLSGHVGTIRGCWNMLNRRMGFVLASQARPLLDLRALTGLNKKNDQNAKIPQGKSYTQSSFLFWGGPTSSVLLLGPPASSAPTNSWSETWRESPVKRRSSLVLEHGDTKRNGWFISWEIRKEHGRFRGTTHFN
jgi:hypothetical protein